jgi:hypothetical protein
MRFDVLASKEELERGEKKIKLAKAHRLAPFPGGKRGSRLRNSRRDLLRTVFPSALE